MIPLRNKYMMMERELDKGFELRNLSDCLIKIVRTTVSVVVFYQAQTQEHLHYNC